MRKKLSFFLVFSCLLVSNTLIAASTDSCAPVDLRRKLGPPRDQGDTGWCYAHTSADLVGFQLGQRISPFDIAAAFVFTDLRFLSNQDNRWLSFLKQNDKIELRWQSNLQDQKNQLEPGVVECFDKGFYQFGGLDEAAMYVSQKKGFCREAALPTAPSAVQAKAEELLALYDSGNEEDYSKFLDEWLDQKCGNRLQGKKFLVPSSLYLTETVQDLLETYPNLELRRQKQQFLKQKIDQLISAQIPVSIGYSAYDLLDQNSSRVMKIKFRAKNLQTFFRRASDLKAPRCEEARLHRLYSEPADEDEDIHGDHASLVVARRSVNGSCQYFVRNSFGKGCDGYLGSLLKRCDIEAGGAWVTLDELPTLYSLAWL